MPRRLGPRALLWSLGREGETAVPIKAVGDPSRVRNHTTAAAIAVRPSSTAELPLPRHTASNRYRRHVPTPFPHLPEPLIAQLQFSPRRKIGLQRCEVLVLSREFYASRGHIRERQILAEGLYAKEILVVLLTRSWKIHRKSKKNQKNTKSIWLVSLTLNLQLI
jgi:hypothetical protein